MSTIQFIGWAGPDPSPTHSQLASARARLGSLTGPQPPAGPAMRDSLGLLGSWLNSGGRIHTLQFLFVGTITSRASAESPALLPSHPTLLKVAPLNGVLSAHVRSAVTTRRMARPASALRRSPLGLLLLVVVLSVQLGLAGSAQGRLSLSACIDTSFLAPVSALRTLAWLTLAN